MHEDLFEPTDAALQQRLAAIDARAYARTRNGIDGRVTRLSPYITHGMIDVAQVIAFLRERHGVQCEHKLVFELAWREYFHHLWDRMGADIVSDVRRPVAEGYRAQLPDDLRHGATGVPVIDQAVRRLYAHGYLHNHARMWVASYAVHLRKVHWRAAADWMFGHLLDGDLASNHLSWQWVAGTLTGKPYLFNADNVARYAPAWASPGTAVDRSYADLEHLARSPDAVGPEPGAAARAEEPTLLPLPPAPLVERRVHALPQGPLRIVHPWALSPPTGAAVGVIVTDYHAHWPWSARRWAFVLERMQQVTRCLLIGTRAQVAALLAGRELVARDTLNPHYRDLLREVGAHCTRPPRFFRNPSRPCRSFSEFWRRVQVDVAA
jgi:deoxyribodipyrimidine photo-lyase